MGSKIGFAMFGLGSMGLVHAKNIMMSGRGSLKWIVRNNLAEAQRFVKTYDLPTRCVTPSQVQDVYNDPEVQAVVVCTPTSTHEGIIQDSLNAGKAVLCEKPVTAHISTTSKCYDLADQKKLPLFCAFHRQFDPNYQKLYSRIRSGELGRIRVMKGTSRDIKPPPISYIKTSGGILADSTVHDLNCSLWIAGSKPDTVYVQGMAFDPEIGKYDMDQVLVTIKYQNEVLSFIDNGRLASYGYDQRFEVLCENGQIKVDNVESDSLSEEGSHVTSVPRICDHFSKRYPEAYNNVVHHFIDVMEGKCELLVTKEDVLTTMKLLQVCRESLDKQTPVKYRDDI